MKWFDRWFAKKCQQAWQNASINSSKDEIAVEADGYSFPRIRPRKLGVMNGSMQKVIQTPRSEIDTRPMLFKLYNASGGWVLEYNFYDEENDENVNSLHVITNDADLGQAISQVITYEILRK